jgi:hypothetical protein
MQSSIIPKEPQQLLLKFLRVLVLVSVLPVCLSGQEHQQWHIVKQLPTQMQKVSYVDRDPDSDEPDSTLQTPTLEAIFFVDNLNGWTVGDGSNILRTRDGG